MSKPVTGFFAHPSRPPALVETIQSFIAEINESSEVQLSSWTSLNTSGKSLITEICDVIDARDFFICDLTYPNPNVLFELGYAIAKGKRVWITLDTSYSIARDHYKQLEILTTIGYSPYVNTPDLVREFYKDRPYQRLNETIYRRSIETLLESTGKPGIFYLKAMLDTDASVRLTKNLNRSTVHVVTSDPYETTTEPLASYAQRINASVGVVVHFLDDERSKDSLQNAKYSLIAGLAYGLGKPTLMLAHAPFNTPLDYYHMLYTHSTAAQAVRALDTWLLDRTEEYTSRLVKYQQYQQQTNRKKALMDVSLGDHVAEDEADELGRYFIDTSQYLAALRGPRAAVFVGRKGTGKSANFNQIAKTRANENRYHVCQIRPVDYELRGLTELLQQDIPRAERGHLIQAFWKFLIYTELARSIIVKLEAKPPHYRPTPDEKILIDFVAQHSGLINVDFADRMRHALAEVGQVDVTRPDVGLTSRINNALHEQIIGQLRTILGRLLEQREKVYILIDNLDKTWGDEKDLPGLADFLSGLLNSANSIIDEFRRTGPDWRQVNVSLLVFLRSDIFDYVMSVAAERDKINALQMSWNNPQLLYSVIEQRFIDSVGPVGTPDEVWERFFTPSIGELPTKEYLVKRIFPRPRDIIYWCKASLNNAINSRHIRIEEEDILQAERDYSQYATESLIAEMVRRVPKVEALLYGFSGANRVLTLNQIRKIGRIAGINNNNELLTTVELLRDTAFLGVETKPNQFSFIYDDSNRQSIMAQATHTQNISKERRFAVNDPYHTFLGIDTVEEAVPVVAVKAVGKQKAPARRRN